AGRPGVRAPRRAGGDPGDPGPRVTAAGGGAPVAARAVAGGGGRAQPGPGRPGGRLTAWLWPRVPRERLAPGVRAVRDRVQVPGGKALVAEGVQQRGVLALQDAGDLLAHGDHLVAVVGVRGDEHVGAHVVKHRKVVHGERAHAAGADLAVLGPGALEALEAVRQGG